MNIEIKSTSFLIPNNLSWDSLNRQNKLNFSEYNNIFNKTKFDQNSDCEIFILFLRDIINYYKTSNNSRINEIKKIKLIISFIEKKIYANNKKIITKLLQARSNLAHKEINLFK